MIWFKTFTVGVCWATGIVVGLSGYVPRLPVFDYEAQAAICALAAAAAFVTSIEESCESPGRVWNWILKVSAAVLTYNAAWYLVVKSLEPSLNAAAFFLVIFGAIGAVALARLYRYAKKLGEDERKKHALDGGEIDGGEGNAADP